MSITIETTVNQTMKANAPAALKAFEAGLTASKLVTHQNLMKQREQRTQGKTLSYFFEAFNGMVYVGKDSKDSFLVMGFKGKAVKPTFYYRFNDEARLTKFISDWATKEVKSANVKAERKNERKALQEQAIELVRIGDIFKSSWGYEQTNVDYYQVIAIKGKSTVTLREICSEIVEETSYLAGKRVPCKDSFKGEEFDKRIAVYSFTDGKPNISVSLSSFETARLKHPRADGSYEPDYFSNYY